MKVAIERGLYSHPAVSTTTTGAVAAAAATSSANKSSGSLSVSASSSSAAASAASSLLDGTMIVAVTDVDPDEAVKFQFLFEHVGFDDESEDFRRFDNAVKSCLLQADEEGWVPLSAETIVEDFLDSMNRKKENAPEVHKVWIKNYHDDMVSWFGRHAEDHEKRLRFLNEIFYQYRAVMVDGADVDYTTGRTVQVSVAS
jgi:hypothetical protein